MKPNRVKVATSALLGFLVVCPPGFGQEGQSSAEEIKKQLAEARLDIELLHRTLHRKQQAEKHAKECAEKLKVAEGRLDELRAQSDKQLAQRDERIKALEQRVAQTKEKLESGEGAESDVEKLKGELDAKIRELTNAQKNAARLAEMLQTAVKEAEELRKAKEKGDKDLAEARSALEDLTKKSGEEKKKLEEERKKFEDEKNKIAGQKGEVDKKLGEANKKVGELNKQVNNYKKDLEQTKKDLNAAFELMKRDRKLKEEAVAKNVASLNELEAAKQQQKKSEETIRKLKAEKQAALMEIEEFRKKLKNQSGASLKRVEELEKRVAEADKLMEQHAELKTQNQRALQQLIDAGLMIQQLAAQREEAKVKLDAAVAAQKEAESKAEQSLNSALEKALKEKKAAEKERDALKQQVNDEKKVSEEIKQACKRAEENLANLKAELENGNKVADSLGGKLREAAEKLAQLRKAKADADKQIESLAAEFEAERENYQSELARQSAQIAALQGQLNRTTVASNARQSAFVDAGAYINQLLVEQKTDARRRKAMELALAEAGDVITELIANQDALRNQVAETRRALGREQASGANTKRSLANANNRISELEQSLSSLSERLKQNQEALAAAKSGASTLEVKKLEVEGTLRETALLLQELVKKQNAQSTKLGEVTRELASAKTDRDSGKSALEKARGEISALRMELEKQKSAATAAAQNAVAVTAVIEALKGDKAKADRKLSELAASLAAAKEANAELMAKHEDTQAALVSRTKDLDQLRAAFKELAQQRDLAEGALEESNDVIRDLLSAKEACESQIADLQAENKANGQQIASLEKEIKTERDARTAAIAVKAETEKQLSALSSELESRKSALAAATEVAQQLRNQMTALTRDRNAVQSEKDGLAKALRVETNRVAQLNERVVALRDELSSKSAEIGRLDALLESSEVKGSEAKSTLLGSAAFLQELIAKREAERKQSQKMVEGLQLQAKTSGERAAQLDKAYKDLQARLEDLRAEGDAKAKERTVLVAELAAAREKIAAFEDRSAEIERLRAYSDSIEQNKLQAESALKEAATLIGELITRREQDTQARRNAERALLKLKTDFEGVEKQAEELRKKLQDLEQLKIKKNEAEDRLASLEQETKKAKASAGGAIGVVEELQKARKDARAAKVIAEKAFQSAALEVERLRSRAQLKEQEFRKLLSSKEGEYARRLDEQRAMLVLANTRLGEVDDRLRMAIEEREKAEQAATEASGILAELRNEKGKLEKRITTLSHLLDKEKRVRDGKGEEMEKLRAMLAEAVVERDQLDVARRAAEKNAIAMGEVLARQASEIDSSRKLAAEFERLKNQLDQATAERDRLTAELEAATELNVETVALKEALAKKELACNQQLEEMLAKAAEREEKLTELEELASRAKGFELELKKLKGEDRGNLQQALKRAEQAEIKLDTEQQKARQYELALKESEDAVAMLAQKMRETDSAYNGALKRIGQLENELSKAQVDKSRALQAALDVKQQLLRIDPIWYALNSASIEEEQARVLKQAKAVLAQYPNAAFEISGHTCTIGSKAANQRLSESRAKVLADYLESNGIPSAQISYEGMGSAEPVGDNATEQGRRRNRRVEVDVKVE